MKIKLIYWVLFFLINFLIRLLFTDRSILAFEEAFAKGLSTTVALLVLLSLIQLIAFVIRQKLRTDSMKVLFGIFGGVMCIANILTSMANPIRSNWEYQVATCIEEFEELAKTKPSIKQYDYKAYCECATEKAKDIPLKDSAKYKDPNSTVYLDLFGPCWQDALIDKRVLGVDAGMLPDTVEVLNLHNHIRVKVKLNGKEIYMIFDSGASDVLISSDMLSDQIASEEIVFTGEELDYEIADGSVISAKMAVVKEFTIGEFTLKDLEIAVGDNVASPLLGKAVLDQFSSWTITSDNQLILIP